MEHEETKAKGLVRKSRPGGQEDWYWVADLMAVKAGYRPKNVRLTPYTPEERNEQANRLNKEVLEFVSGEIRHREFDGTLGSLISIYQIDEESPYHNLTPGSLHPYNHYLGKLASAYGDIRLRSLTGRDVKLWHRAWRKPGRQGPGERLAGAAFALNVLKAVVRFGNVNGFPDCQRLLDVMRDLKLPNPAPRNQAPIAGVIDRAREAAHAMGRHRAALCYALQFETTGRQWDFVGQWVPRSDPRPSAIVNGGKKWLGPTWEVIDSNMILSFVPSKTERTTGVPVIANLQKCPMVVEELAKIPREERVGPLVIDEKSGQPFAYQNFNNLWKKVRAEAGISDKVWNRDIRAGGISEGQAANARSEDRAKLSGHSQKMNESVYSRDILSATDRVLDARAAFRKNGQRTLVRNKDSDKSDTAQ
jgi:hypothetical protein